MKLFYFLCLIFSVNAYIDLHVPDHKQTFDWNLFEEVLDEELCHEQMQFLVNNDTSLLLRFLDAGIRLPRGIFEGNFADLGNYHQCLGINENVLSSTIEGKYCLIHVPLEQNLELPSFPEWPEWPEIPWPEIPWPELNPDTARMSPDLLNKVAQYEAIKRSANTALGGGGVDRVSETSALAGIQLLLATCIPKSCTTKQAFSELFLNATEIGLEFHDYKCRLPNDKQWVAGDYTAIALFSFLGLVLLASTAYDIHQTVILENDPKSVNKLYQSFSVYTNTRRLVTYTPVPGVIECLDGVRSFAMMWVIVGHTFVNQLTDIVANPIAIINWITTPQAIWITMAPITVDTFFLISGLLLVYTTAGKMTGPKLIKNVHKFYLNRLLRMFPPLAAWILFNASILNRVADGPYWEIMQGQTHNCRVFWWSTLLYVQNWVNPSSMCLPHSWYLAIDMQLYILSPLILFWVLGRKKSTAWIALVTPLLLSLVGSSVFNFMMELQSGPVIPSRSEEDGIKYLTKYYVNTLTRASPFFVGMIYGYILHLNRKQRMVLPMRHVAVLWICTVAILATNTYLAYPIMQFDWDNQTVDSVINTFTRPAWALAIGWIVVACHHGYGGPINWILSLSCFKILSRLSYAMYIVHYPLIFLVNATKVAPIYFSPGASLFKFLADLTLAIIVAYIVTIMVDSPCSILIKRFMGGGPKAQSGPAKTLAEENNASNGISNRGFEDEETKKSAL